MVGLLIVLLSGSGGSGDGASEADTLAADADARAAVRTAWTAMETYATDHGGEYTGATAEDLKRIEPTLGSVSLSVGRALPKAYSLSVTSAAGGNVFTQERLNDGTTLFTCTEEGSGDCPVGGNWGG
jgi:hypothetical protein